MRDCLRRHPQICRNFSKNYKCRFNEECAYSHQNKVDSQHHLNEQVTLLLLKPEKNIKALTEEVNTLKNIINTISAELIKINKQKLRDITQLKKLLELVKFLNNFYLFDFE